MTLTFDLLTLKLVRNIARVMGYPPAHFGDTMTIRFRFMGHWANMAETDHVTLTFDLVTLKLVCESHLRWGTFVSNLVTLGLWVLESLCTRRTDRRMDGQKQPLFPLPYGRGIIMSNQYSVFNNYKKLSCHKEAVRCCVCCHAKSCKFTPLSSTCPSSCYLFRCNYVSCIIYVK